MPSYSSDQFRRDWRYAVAKEFKREDGSDFPYADGGHLQWDDEVTKLEFETPATSAAISSDKSRMAVVVDCNIHILSTETWDTIAVLKGHYSKPSAVAFKPGDSNTLISSEAGDRTRETPKWGPNIIVWKIDAVKDVPALKDETLTEVTEAGLSTVAEKLAGVDMKLDDDDLKTLRDALKPAVARAVTKHAIPGHARMEGRLTKSFQSTFISPSGRQMVYMPGKSPRSNDVAPWDMVLCTPDDFGDKLTLKGHTDAIMWTGWSPDESRFASVAWDGTIRMWDSSTGEETHKFETDRQNWTGGFSPDGKYFATTDGHGIVRLYSMGDGSLYWEYKKTDNDRWRRAIAWHPDSTELAVGGERAAEVLILDVAKKELIQERLLSGEKSHTDRPEQQKTITTFCPVQEVQYVDHGTKLAVWTYGDASIELYDMEKQVKWRFARGGTEDLPGAEKWRDEDGKVTTKGGSGMQVWEDKARGKVMLASLDFDAIRIWTVPLTEC